MNSQDHIEKLKNGNCSEVWAANEILRLRSALETCRMNAAASGRESFLKQQLRKIYKLTDSVLTTEQFSTEEWLWKMDYCKSRNLAPVDELNWEKASEAYKVFVESCRNSN